MSRVSTAPTAKVRPPAHAGRFYPADPVELGRMIAAFLSEVSSGEDSAPKALIAPHAGYIYSGPIAASAFARLERDRDLIQRVVLIGPAHYESFAGLATSAAEAFAT